MVQLPDGPGLDVTVIQIAEQPVPLFAVGLPKSEGVEPAVGAVSASKRKELSIAAVCQFLPVEGIVPALDLQKAVQLFQLRKAQGRLLIGHAVVVAPLLMDKVHGVVLSLLG